MPANLSSECVLITCRTQFFLRDDEIPQETGIARGGARKSGEPRELKFRKLYIQPLNDEQVEQFLRRRYPIWQLWLWKKRKQARAVVRRIPLLSGRPLLLDYVPYLLKSAEYESRFAVQLYDQMVKGWLEGEQSLLDKNASESKPTISRFDWRRPPYQIPGIDRHHHSQKLGTRAHSRSRSISSRDNLRMLAERSVWDPCSWHSSQRHGTRYTGCGRQTGYSVS